MDERQRWVIIGANLDRLVPFMLSLPKGSSADVFTDASGSNLYLSKPTAAADVKLCSVVPDSDADFAARYDIHPDGAGYVNGDGEKIPRDRLATTLIDYIRGMKDGGGEWGWEFKVDG
jgi:hypothetical protein